MPDSNPSVYSQARTDEQTSLSNSGYSPEFIVQFWGVRSGLPTPSSENSRYGGNTTCVEMQIGGQRLIFDGGSGLRMLGKTLVQQQVEAHIFFTHSHWDRIQGFPFFTPAFIRGNCFHIYGATAVNGASMKQRLSDQMLQPHFPYPLQVMQSDLKFHQLNSGKVIALGDITIQVGLINKVHRAMGFRVTGFGHTVVYAADLKPAIDTLEPSLIQLAGDADLLISNASGTAPTGHESQSIESSWQTAVALADCANVKRLALFHYDPDHNDDCLDQVEASVHAAFPKCLLTREGMTLTIV